MTDEAGLSASDDCRRSAGRVIRLVGVGSPVRGGGPLQGLVGAPDPGSDSAWRASYLGKRAKQPAPGGRRLLLEG